MLETQGLGASSETVLIQDIPTTTLATQSSKKSVRNYRKSKTVVIVARPPPPLLFNNPIQEAFNSRPGPNGNFQPIIVAPNDDGNLADNEQTDDGITASDTSDISDQDGMDDTSYEVYHSKSGIWYVVPELIQIVPHQDSPVVLNDWDCQPNGCVAENITKVYDTGKFNQEKYRVNSAEEELNMDADHYSNAAVDGEDSLTPALNEGQEKYYGVDAVDHISDADCYSCAGDNGDDSLSPVPNEGHEEYDVDAVDANGGHDDFGGCSDFSGGDYDACHGCSDFSGDDYDACGGYSDFSGGGCNDGYDYF